MAEATTGSLLGEGGELALQLLSASMSSNYDLMDSLYEQERTRRQALEVHIENVLRHADQIAGGTTRQYEEVMDHLALYPVGYDAEQRYAKNHRENQEN